MLLDLQKQYLYYEYSDGGEVQKVPEGWFDPEVMQEFMGKPMSLEDFEQYLKDKAEHEAEGAF
jgi:methionine salvage enolase-phosphatase E1